MCPKFLADGMLGKIAKKLRIIGFDTEYLANTDDNMIIKMCFDKRRTILTKDRQLYARSLKLNIPCILITLENELESLITIMKEYDIHYIFPVTNKFTRCTLCNGTLDTVLESLLMLDDVPKKVLKSTDVFFKCSNCQKIYWNGTHIKEINHLIDEINKEIKE
ncbi:MAG: Mut7-C RNAse domain-containing protein [Thermoproteota archaeon]|nr:Mut7-C RNAse domain-containing protein [Thermoproteota archaeon]